MHVAMQLAAQTVVMLIVIHLVLQTGDAHLLAMPTAQTIAQSKVVMLIVQIQIVQPSVLLLVMLVVRKIVLRVVMCLVLLHVLMTVRVFALQEVWHVVIVARTNVQVVVMETAQLIVNSHVLTQK